MFSILGTDIIEEDLGLDQNLVLPRPKRDGNAQEVETEKETKGVTETEKAALGNVKEIEAKEEIGMKRKENGKYYYNYLNNL